MRIRIEHHQPRDGLLFKRTWHEVHLSVHFTHEEKQIIRQHRLEGDPILERWPADAREGDEPHWYTLRVGNLLYRHPDRFRCRTPSDAKLYEARLLEVLEQMKGWLDANAEPAGTTIVEL